MRYLSLILLFIGCAYNLMAQESFNLIYDDSGNSELSYFSSEVVQDSSYIVTATSFNASYSSYLILKIDDKGNVIDSVDIRMDSIKWFPESIDMVNDSIYVATGTAYNIFEQEGNFFILKLASNLDIKFLNFYKFRGGHEGGKKVIAGIDGGYLLAGFSQTYPNDDSQVYLLKTDNQGKKEWELAYGDSALGEEPWDILIRQDSSYIISSESFHGNGYNIHLANISKDGKMLYQNKIESTISKGASSLHKVRNGYILGGVSREDFFANSRAYAVKVDDSFNVIWEKLYTNTPVGSFSAGDQYPDGSIIMAGSYDGPETLGDNRDGFLLKIDTNGNELWRKVINPKGQYIDDADDYFYGVTATSDGGVLATGFTFSGPISGTQDAWILKLDSLGRCDSATCFPWLYTGIEDDPAIVKENWLYPNPARNYIQVEFDGSKKELQIVNMQGQLLKQQILEQSNAVVDVSALPAGTYVAVLQDVDGELRRQQFSVVR